MLFDNTISINNFQNYIEKIEDDIERFNSSLLANNIRNSAYKNTMSGKDIDGKPFAPLKFRKGQPLMDKGHMLNSMLVKNGKTSSIYIKGSLQRLKANVHQNGALIRPKRAKMLRFKANGTWYSAKQVNIPQRKFFPEIGSKLVKDETEDFKKLVLKFIKKG